MTNTASGGAVAPASSQKDTDTAGLKVIYLALARQSILEQVLEIEGAVDKAKTLSSSPDVPSKVRDLAEDFVTAHGHYQSHLSNFITECRETTDLEKRKVGWSLGPLLGSKEEGIRNAPIRITDEFIVQAKDSCADRFFEERASGYYALMDALAAKDAAASAKSEQRPNRSGFFSSLLSFGRS